MDLAAELIALARAIMERGVESDFRQTLLHGDSCAGNFVFSECRGQSKERVEKCAILDVETFKRGSRAQDLIVPFSIHCAHGGFQRAHVERLLSSYEGEHPLSEGERDYLYAHLALPRHWLRIARRLLKGSRAWWSPLHLQKLRYALKRLPSQKRLAESILGR
jgi:Ser/Thr protein kinase RdoA (MazF antagonist)